MPLSSTHLVLLPSYNTGPRLRDVVAEALQHWQPVMVVIDGSTDGSEIAVLNLAREAAPGAPAGQAAGPARSRPAETPAAPIAPLSVIVLPRNSGKGAAVLAGAQAAAARGFTHVLAMDADGQHPAAKIAEFMAISQRHPDALVLGSPIFPSNIPRERLYCRKLSVALVRWTILGRGIDDNLYGFRVYPVAPLLEVLGPRRSGRRYDFDTEAAVRLCWRGVRPINVPAPVRYFSRAEGGVSHFHYVRDNLTLARMHTRLVFELPWHARQLRRHRQRWASEAAATPRERTSGLVSHVAR
jgi:glycosyltransferase involved in cell wall biosynthesis